MLVMVGSKMRVLRIFGFLINFYERYNVQMIR